MDSNLPALTNVGGESLNRSEEGHHRREIGTREQPHFRPHRERNWH